jgi:hypothetical protein
MVRGQEWGLRVSPGAFQFSLRDHPRRNAGLQLARVHSGLHAPSQPGKDGDEALWVILLAEARLDPNHHPTDLVHEVSVLRHQVSEAVSDLPQALLQGAQPWLQRGSWARLSEGASTYLVPKMEGASVTIAQPSLVKPPYAIALVDEPAYR